MVGLLCVNKPKDWTSFDVVNKLKRIFRTKVGHTGTLDPQATGVLVCLVGATKALPFLDMSTKTYVATCQLGLKTHTADIWGEVLIQQDPKPINQENLKTILKKMLGKQMQQVPLTSAKKVKGKKLLDYQRQNIEIETPQQEIEIFEIQLLEVNETQFTFSAKVSSGTYMRTLCEDIASQLGELGTMSSLIRTQCGPFTLDDCVEIDAVSFEALQPLEVGLQHYPAVEVDDEIAIKSGKELSLEYKGEVILIKKEGTLLAMYQYDKINHVYRSLRGLWI